MYKLIIVLLFVSTCLVFPKIEKIYQGEITSDDDPKTIVLNRINMTSPDSINFVAECADTMYVKLLGIPISFLNGVPLGDTLSIFNDTVKASSKVLNKTYARFPTKYVYFKLVLKVYKVGTPVNSSISVYYYKREED